MCAPDRPKSPTNLNDAPSGPPDASRDLLAHPRMPRASNPGGSLGFNRPNRLPNSGLVAPHPGGRPTQLLSQTSKLTATSRLAAPCHKQSIERKKLTENP